MIRIGNPGDPDDVPVLFGSPASVARALDEHRLERARSLARPVPPPSDEGGPVAVPGCGYPACVTLAACGSPCWTLPPSDADEDVNPVAPPIPRAPAGWRVAVYEVSGHTGDMFGLELEAVEGPVPTDNEAEHARAWFGSITFPGWTRVGINEVSCVVGHGWWAEYQRDGAR